MPLRKRKEKNSSSDAEKRIGREAEEDRRGEEERRKGRVRGREEDCRRRYETEQERRLFPCY